MAQIGYKTGKEPTPVTRKGRLSERKFVAAQQQRGRQIIADWLKALQAAENPQKPNRELLYRLYNNLVIDGDFTSEWETRRKLRIKGASFDLLNADNKADEEATKMLKTQWFQKLLDYGLDSKPWGTSVVEIKSLTPEGLIDDVELLNRRHIIPELGLWIDKVGDEKGILYREDQSYSRWLFEFGEPNDLGFLAKAAPYILFMRFALSAWSEYAEKFVMPVRVAKTNATDKAHLGQMEKMLLDMGTASFAILNKDETLEFVETAKTDGSNVFDKLMQTCAAKLSKLINGAVIGEASQGGSRSKEEVGQDIQNLVTMADMMWFEGIMNQRILPRLVSMGYPFQDLTFQFERQRDLKFLLEVVDKLLSEYDIPEDFITDNFNIPVTKKAVPNPRSVKPGTTARADDFFA